jgi:hypothetical protein
MPLKPTLQEIISPDTFALQTLSVSTRYQREYGFPHIVIDNFLVPSIAEHLWSVFPFINDAQWINYFHYNEKKYGLSKRDAMPPIIGHTIDMLNSQEFINFLSDLTGIKDLISDPSLEGGGLHQVTAAGFLNIHADFTTHPHHRHWRRRINVLIYFNKEWQNEFGGELELWTRDMSRVFRKVAPIFNRCVIFNTDEDAYHGHPDPLGCPADVTRKSIALYYYTQDKMLPLKRATNYQPRPGEGMLKSILIFLDKKALVAYNSLKGILGINDDLVSKILQWIFRRWK